VTAGYIDDDGRYQELTRAECEALLSLEANGRPVTVDIGSLGSYRVLAAKDAETGDIVITGLSMKVDNALVRTQLLIEGAIAVAGTLTQTAIGSTLGAWTTWPMTVLVHGTRAAIRRSRLPEPGWAEAAQRVLIGRMRMIPGWRHRWHALRSIMTAAWPRIRQRRIRRRHSA